MNTPWLPRRGSQLAGLCVGVALAVSCVPAHAQVVDHDDMGHDMPPTPPGPTDHSAMGHQIHGSADQPGQPVPALTDADRSAAFPAVSGHHAHDDSIQEFVLVDRLEGWNADDGSGLAWDALGWIGTDLNRLWLRSEGERIDGTTQSADLELLYGRGVARWWDFVVGVRHDLKPGPSQTFAAVGITGLTPYKFDFGATAYVGESGQTAARLEAGYETLLGNRLVLQWLLEGNLYGRTDAPRSVGSGLSTVEAGLRMRYEFTRRFAPYIGIAWARACAGTADLRREQGDDIEDTRFVVGLRTWF